MKIMGAQLTVALPGTPPGTAIDQPGSQRAAMKLCFPPVSAHERRIRLTPSAAAHDPGLAHALVLSCLLSLSLSAAANATARWVERRALSVYICAIEVRGDWFVTPWKSRGRTTQPVARHRCPMNTEVAFGRGREVEDQPDREVHQSATG
jgi:hypothetical protein